MYKEFIEFVKSEECNLTLYDLALNYIEAFKIDGILKKHNIKLSEEEDRKLTIEMVDAQDLLIDYVFAKFGDYRK